MNSVIIHLFSSITVRALYIQVLAINQVCRCKNFQRSFYVLKTAPFYKNYIQKQPQIWRINIILLVEKVTGPS